MIKPLTATAILFCALSVSCLAQDVPLKPPAEKINDHANPVQKHEKVFTFVEQMPRFPGGQDSLASFLGRNINYPPTAVRDNFEGTVYITFIVTYEGNITDIKILRDIGDGCGAEAVRVVALMPKWTPGRQNGAAVNVQFTLPVRFTLAKG